MFSFTVFSLGCLQVVFKLIAPDIAILSDTSRDGVEHTTLGMSASSFFSCPVYHVDFRDGDRDELSSRLSELVTLGWDSHFSDSDL